MGFCWVRGSRTPGIILAGVEPNDEISCELAIAENTRLTELKWRKHRQSGGSVQGPGRRSVTALGNVLHHGFYGKCDKHAQCSAATLKADTDTSVLEVRDPALQTSINVLGLSKTRSQKVIQATKPIESWVSTQGQRVKCHQLLCWPGQVLNSVSVLNSWGLTPTSDRRSEPKGYIGESKEKVYKGYPKYSIFQK